MTDPPMKTPEGGQEEVLVDGRYRLIERVGSGGMADVWCAEDQQLGRKVALKLLHRRFAEDDEFVERFRREASSAAGLQHPNVVSVYDRGEWDGTYYIAMEFLAGRSLKQLVRDDAPLDPLRAIDLTIQVLKAARFAHSRGIVHRDIKPHNVIVDDEDRAKVTDFGIARAGASDMTETGSIMGTAQYLSPEQAQGHAVSAQSDLYAIGIVLYELLTGRVPFEGDSAVTVALKQVSEEPVPPSAWNPAIPAELDGAVLRALEKDPAARYADADAFIAALEDMRDRIATGVALGGGTVAFGAVGPAAAAAATSVGVPPPDDFGAYPPEPPAGFEGEPGRRKRWPWIVAGVGVACLLGGLIALAATGALSDEPKVTVPRVVGLQAATAQAVLQHAGFEVNQQRFVNPAPADQVFGQDPGAGEQAGKGSTVVIRISQGPAQTTVPDTLGDPLGDARRTLRDAGFQVRTVKEFSDSVPPGNVARTVPDAGQRVDQGSSVTIHVSKGPQPVAVPGVVGKQRDEAQAALESAGFHVTVDEQETADSAPGTVTAQNPGSGVTASKGSTVTIAVAKQPPDAQVPDVTGFGERRAAGTLRLAGFQVSTQEQPVGDPEEDGHVVDQSPSGTVPRGSTVTITIGKFDPSLSPDSGATVQGSGSG
jgi:serine/threonine-protein kinase